MEQVFDVFVTDPVVIDHDVYCIWLRGLNIDDAVIKRLQSSSYLEHEPTAHEQDEIRHLIWKDTVDQYRLFGMIEPFFKNATISQPYSDNLMLFQLPVQTQQYVIEQYYSFHPQVIRSLLGRKLTTKFRKDLDEITETTDIPLRSCRRQFDNLKRIFNLVEDRNYLPGCDVRQFLSQSFYFNSELATDYTCILFLLYHQFQLDISAHREVKLLTLEDLCFCAQVMLTYWVGPSSNSSALAASFPAEAISLSRPTILGIEFDVVFIGHLRDIRTYMLINDRNAVGNGNRKIVQQLTENKNDSVHEQLLVKIQAHNSISLLLHGLITIGGNLSQQKAVKNFFQELVQSVVVVLKDMKITKDEIQSSILFETIAHLVEITCYNAWYIQDPHTKAQYILDWKRFVGVCQTCIVHIYSRF